MVRIISIVILASLLTGCEKLLIPGDEENTAQNNFRIFWEDYNMHHVLFDHYSLNWDSIYNYYYPKVTNDNLEEALLMAVYYSKDGHFSLTTNTDTYYHFQFDTIPAGYTDNSPSNVHYYLSLNKLNDKLSYGIIDNIGYCSISSFGGENGQLFEQIDNILDKVKDTEGLIIDIRSNSGGISDNAEIIASRFFDQKTLYVKRKFRNGANHSDFTGYYLDYINPHLNFDNTKPIVILTNNYTASSAELFVLAMKLLPNVITIGDTTSGGLGTNETHELLNGWTYRITIALAVSADDKIYEGVGIPPDIYAEITALDFENKKDNILEEAIKYVKQ